MEISRHFFDILKYIDYNGHLHRDMFVNEAQIPELLPIFTWFINNVSPKFNCVTQKELFLYNSLLPKNEHFSSLEKVSKATNKFYNKNTMDSKVCSSDLEILEKKILKAQQELNYLKVYGTLYEEKTYLVNDEISLLKQKEKDVKVSCYNSESNLKNVMEIFTIEVDTLGYNIEKLHNHIANSLTYGNANLTSIASKNLVNITDIWHQKILKMINLWFNEPENISPEINDIFSSNTYEQILLYQSIEDLRTVEINNRSDITKLNIILNNISNIKNYYKDKGYLHSNGSNIINYLANDVQHLDISINDNEQFLPTENDDLQSIISDAVVEDAKQKLLKKEIIRDRIIFAHDTIEQYIMICDLLYCLMRTDCSMVNLKCELVLHCIDILNKVSDDIAYAQRWSSNSIVTNAQHSDIENINYCEVIKFDGYKHNSEIYSDSNEIEKLSKMVRQWKSKYHYTKDECNKLFILQQKLQEYATLTNSK